MNEVLEQLQRLLLIMQDTDDEYKYNTRYIKWVDTHIRIIKLFINMINSHPTPSRKVLRKKAKKITSEATIIAYKYADEDHPPEEWYTAVDTLCAISDVRAVINGQVYYKK